ncbi:MAG: type transport system ATP-binding protein [Acidobacteriota bacterium]|jgi:ABC-2 type transport system ATP-binding protein|nr:type transport system ATP-binding protein [Acidobacteriota bacterium]
MSSNVEYMPEEYAIETRNLGRKFGKFEAVKGVDLTVPKGTVFGLLGVNGAGKSTIIKMIMGHLRPTSGEVRILGRALGEDLVEIRKRVAYVSENRYLYEWMTVAESITFTRAFHATWDDRKAADLLKRFSLPPEKKVRQLSRGNRARLCLLLALSFNPELIVLDEPTSGLDPIVRRDFIENIVSEIAEEGKTVLFSSHIVEEVERVADYVGIMDEGELLLVSTIDEIKSSYKRVRYATNGTRPEVTGVVGVMMVENGRHEQVLTVQGFGDETMRQLGERGVKNPEVLPISLEDIFVSAVRAERERRASL